jgi:hypothetical protein
MNPPLMGPMRTFDPCSVFRALLLAARVALFLLTLLLLGITESSAASEVRFADEIRPIFNKNCVACHGGVKRAAKISFIVPDLVVAHGPGDTKKPIQPGAPEKSEIIRRITSKDPKVRMPPPEHGRALTDGEIEKMRTWIAQGANWEVHWAFVPPKNHTPPQVRDTAWPRMGLDTFILAKIEAAGLKPSPAASRRAWLRRVSFDLTGLPPTLEEIEAFENDSEANAREKIVDRLLASPSFGERWATVWLDLARYADSMGFEKDPLRTVWPWRDWVIRSLNANMPFDEFTLRQLAGDLMPGNTFEDLIATAFHRNTQNNTEGGTDDEEFRIAAVLDRVNTTFEAWQGVTFKCAQCHSHPYEPIDQEEYYRAAAFFNNTRDWDLREDYPLLRVPLDTNQFCEARDLDQVISELRRTECAESRQLTSATCWLPLRPAKAESDKGTKLVIDGNAEIRTEGTVAHYSKFTVEAEVAPTGAPLTAIRLEALPTNPEKARLTPEMGFMISFFRAVLIRQDEIALTNRSTDAEGKKEERGQLEEKSLGVIPGEIVLTRAFADEAEPFHDAESILDPDVEGWGALPRITGMRQIVFVPREPVTIPTGARLKFLIFHDEGPGDFAALVMRRFSLSFATNSAWTEFVGCEQFAASRAKLMDTGCRRAGINTVELPVIAEQEPQLRRTDAVFIRGNWLNKGREVSARVPAIYPPLELGAAPDRLSFARWLVATNNPLTARVLANRIWEQVFGVGIVETLEDFGSSGEPPFNPELLDYLAIRLQHDLHWDLKAFLREIVLSTTYGQDSRVDPQKFQADPRNRLLARGPRVRLSAEMVRDQALEVSGLLSSKRYGPPVMPPQPDGIWRSAYSSDRWATATGEDRYRRAIYTYVRRTAGYPSFQTFDAPTREVCTARRLRTNTPLQALVTMNDPVYVECSLALAKKIQAKAGDSLSEGIRYGYEAVTGELPSAADISDLSDLHASALTAYKSNQDEAAKLADTPELAALAIVANTILNLDSTLNR